MLSTLKFMFTHVCTAQSVQFCSAPCPSAAVLVFSFLKVNTIIVVESKALSWIMYSIKYQCNAILTLPRRLNRNAPLNFDARNMI